MLTRVSHDGRARRDVCAVILGLLLLNACARHAAREPTNPASPASASAAPSSFQLTDDQLRTLSSEQIVLHDFHSETMTDGRIAYNADTLTAVYSPYSGRVTRVLAALGAEVKRGQPLFE